MQKIAVETLEFNLLNKQKYTSKDQLISMYWDFHPRFRFFKTLRLNSRLLDIGAGEGGLFCWKQWNPPIRNDIEMYAVDLFKGKLFDKYTDFQICNLDQGDIKYIDNTFDSIIASHVLEHIQNEHKFLKEVKRVLKKGGGLYIEIPTIETLNYPSRDIFSKKGICVSTTNFFDDKMHLRTFDLDQLADMLKNGFKILEKGIIENKYLEDELFTFGIKNNDQETATYGVWSKLRWSQYIICEKI